MSGNQQRQGEIGESAAEYALKRLGVYNVAKIPVDKICAGKKTIYKERVLGDRRGELANGISVLAEVKTTRNKTRLTWSAFTSPKQPKNLDDHRGLSLLVWVCETDWTREIYVIDWRVLLRYGFQKGAGIGIEDAEKIRMTQKDFDFLGGISKDAKCQFVHVSMDTVAPF